MGGSTGAVWPVRVHSALPVPGAPADVKWQPGPSFRHRAEGVATEQYAMGCDTVLYGRVMALWPAWLEGSNVTGG